MVHKMDPGYVEGFATGFVIHMISTIRNRYSQKLLEYPDSIKFCGLINILCTGDRLVGVVLGLINILYSNQQWATDKCFVTTFQQWSNKKFIKIIIYSSALLFRIHSKN